MKQNEKTSEMLTAEEIEVFSREQGFLAEKLFVIFTRPTNGIEPIKASSEAHLERQIQLERDGILFGAGPLYLPDGKFCSGEGMIIIRADNLQHAIKIAEQDPMHQSGARDFEVRPWLLNEGSLSLRVELSSGRWKLT